ncbi:hypothetical protein CBR_g3433 [Chara braunii]|uniref:RNA-directed DNA polymerase n=1 Tax=Chara braunii TaxID=69332 RepID=A0A388JQT7_CHABU|nr:hypothetical protein CBR_g3433 [Chara braunii]|eukprot:GBG60189.1 hypothetical protein CBR_g3433 [Chara braunii]
MRVEDYVEGVQTYFRLEKDGKVEKVFHSLTLLVEDSLPFDIVLGMDWGEAVGATLHLREHECRIPSPSGGVKTARLFHVSGVCNSLAHCCLSALAFARLVKKEQLEEQVFIAYVRPLTEPKEEKPIDPAIAKLLEELTDLAKPPIGVVPRPIQHRIEIEPGSRTPKGAVYRMSPRELEELRKQLDELLEKGWIRPSSSPFGAPVLFVPKKEGEFRMFVVVYLDDILVFSKTLQEHEGHLRQVLEKLREANVKINAKKCEWAKTQVLYLGHVLDRDGIKQKDSKIATIRDWPTPRTLTELRSFLGLANYYRKFVRNFSTIAAPLRRLLRKEAIWKWDKDCTSAMKKLKQAVLKVADPSLPFVVTTDASQYGIGAVLQQDDGNGYRPVEFMSARMPSEKVATSTYERELYTLRQALEHWKHYLLGRHFKVYSNHETLRWLKTQAKMTPKLTGWAAKLDQYDFELKPVKGKYNVVADALCRRAAYFGAIVHYLDIGRDLQQKVKEAYVQDPIYSDLLRKVKEAPETEPDYRTTDGLLFEKTNVEIARERERLKREEEEKLKAVEEEEEEDEQPLERRRAGGRGESSGAKEDLMEKKITEWVAGLSLGEDEEALMYVPREEQEAVVKEWDAEEDPRKRQVLEDEKRMEWKFRLTRERKRRMEAASQAAKELEEIKKQRDQMATQVDLLGKMEIMETPTPHMPVAKVAGRCLNSCPKTACVRVCLGTSLTGVADELKERMPAWAKMKKESRGQLVLVDVEIFRGRVGALVDSGATRSYISRKALQKLKLGLEVQKLAEPVVSILADNHTMRIEDYIEGVQAYFRLEKDGKVEKVLHSLTLLVEDNLPFDIVLGMDWGEAAGTTLHLREHECRLPSPSGGVKTARLFHVSGVDNSLAHCCLSTPAFARLVKKEQLEEQVFVAYVRPVTQPKEEKPMDPAIAKLLEEFTDLAKPRTGVVPRPIQHRIEIEPGSRTLKGAVYRMSPRELEELRKQLDELLEKGWIRPSSFPFGAPFLFVPKKKGDLRMCIDYRGMNAITVKNAEPLPRIDDLLDRVQGCRYFSKIDLKSGYHQIEVHPDDEYKTTFRTRYGHYEFIVMPFGLTNAPVTFQRCMNDLFRPWLDGFVVVYLDDILVFSKPLQEHQGHPRQVLEKLREANFKINAKKCKWVKTQVLYLGHVLDGDGIKPEDSKIAAIRDWPTPRTLTELWSFLGLANYYRKFVRNFSTIAAPLRRLLKKEAIWKWDKDFTSSMKKLKQALIEYLVLKAADPSLPFVVTTDASQYGIGVVLQQDDGHGYRPVEFISARMPS